MFSFGQTLEILRTKRGITQHRLGLLAQVSPSSINRIEKGERGIPEVGTLIAIADALGLSKEERLSLLDAATMDAIREKIETLSVYYLALAGNDQAIVTMAQVFEGLIANRPELGDFVGYKGGPLAPDQMERLLIGAATMPMFASFRQMFAPEMIRRVTIDMTDPRADVQYGALGLNLIGEPVENPDLARDVPA